MRRAQPWKTNRSRALRFNATSAEDVLWYHLRNRNLNGFKFVRQAPIENFFADFLCRETRLIVEVDGGTHGEPHEIAADAVRTAVLEKLGFKIIRTHNRDIYDNIDGVLEHIVAVLEGRIG
jgi:very-short-patch-repair endonuclease